MNETLLEAGRAAASRGDWQQAHDVLVRAEAHQSTRGEDLLLVADVAYAAGHLDVTFDSLERLHAESVRAGDRLAAAGAATRVALHLLFDTALIAPTRGWVRRAEQLLGDRDATPVHAWLAVARNYERLLSGDFREARRWARTAIELGTVHEPAAAAVGRIAEARSLILDGSVPQGLELLDEAAMAAVSGELDPLFTGVVYCELVCAMQAIAQYDLAEQWTQAMERWRPGGAIGSMGGRCRVHRAEILRLRGSTDEAEREALRACEELRPYLRRELGWPLTELGRIRLRKGDLDGAEQAFFAAHESGWDPQPELAKLFLARGDVARAAASIRDALEHPLRIPSKELPPNTDLRLAPLLEAQVEIAVAAVDLGRARWAASELDQIAKRFGSKALVASACAAGGHIRLAERDAAGAIREYDEAVRLWSEVGAPYELAVTRTGLAEAYRLEGNEARALLELRSARSTFERIGAAHDAERVDVALGRSGREQIDVGESSLAPGVAREARTGGASHHARCAFQREGEYWSVTFDGRTTRLRDMKGLRYIARLLGAPGRAIHVLDLVADESRRAADVTSDIAGPAGTAARGDAGEMLDARAKDAYRRRIAEIDEDIADARTAGDADREAQAEAERTILVRELARAVGLGGRDRRSGSAAERARVSVTRAVRAALARARAHHESLGAHLDCTIRTGTYCTYVPDPRAPVKWEL